MGVLVDSSVWIAAADPSRPECMKLKRLIAANEALYVTRFIQVEVSQGARTEEQFHQLWSAFLGFQFIEIGDRDWGRSAWNYFRCRKKGLTPSTMDCLIATVAKEHQVPLWTADRHFKLIQRVIGFDLY